MIGSILFSTWVLLVSATTTQCQGTDCRLLAGRAALTQLAATFPTRAACETFRMQMAPTAPMVVQWDAPRPLTIRKDILATCQERKETP
jgi:hypothetical protein